ncbi:MAG: hypothetical protein EOP08_16875, partial [Proteobacteria bacterium]
ADLLTDGGLFVATYAKPPSVGTRVLVELALPRGARIKASGVVTFKQDLVEGDGMVEPGFGVRFGELEEESRRILLAYADQSPPLLREI